MKKNEKSSINEKTIRIIFALLLAILLWAFVNGNPSELINQEIVSIPVTIVNGESLQEKNLVIEDNRNYYVNLSVKGTENNLKNINRDEITAEIDLSEIKKKGVYEADIAIKGLSNSVILERVRPNKVKLLVDDITEKSWHVTVITEGKPIDGKEVISTNVLQEVKLEGSEALLNKVDKIIALVNVNGLSDDSQQYTMLSIYDKEGKVIPDLKCEPGLVKVDVLIGKTKQVAILPPQTIGQVASGFKVTKITITPNTKRIGAKEEVLKDLTSIQIPSIDITGKSTTLTQSVNIDLPENVYFMNGENEVAVTINIEPVSEKSFSIEGIETRNLEQGLSASKISENRIVAKLSGTSGQLNEVDVRELKAYVDLVGLGKGQHTVPISIEAPSGIEIKSTNPSQITVTIE